VPSKEMMVLLIFPPGVDRTALHAGRAHALHPPLLRSHAFRVAKSGWATSSWHWLLPEDVFDLSSGLKETHYSNTHRRKMYSLSLFSLPLPLPLPLPLARRPGCGGVALFPVALRASGVGSSFKMPSARTTDKWR